MAAHAIRIDAHQHFWHYDPVEYALDRRLDARAAARLPARGRAARDARRPASSAASRCRRGRRSRRRSWLLAARRRASVHCRRRRLGRSAVADRRRAARTLSRRIRKLVGVRHIVQAEPDGFLLTPGVPPRRRAPGALRPRPTTSWSTRGSCRRPSASPRAFPSSASCSIISASRTSAAAASTLAAAFRRPLAAFPQRLVQTVGSGHRSRLAPWTPDSLRPYIEAALDMLRPGAADDWVGLAGLHGGRRVCADDARGRRGAWPDYSPAERDADARRHRAAVLES